jgi:hypothetical protein
MRRIAASIVILATLIPIAVAITTWQDTMINYENRERYFKGIDLQREHQRLFERLRAAEAAGMTDDAQKLREQIKANEHQQAEHLHSIPSPR